MANYLFWDHIILFTDLFEHLLIETGDKMQGYQD